MPKPASSPRKPASKPDAVTVVGIRLTHPDKVLWTDQGLSKRELAAYYEAIAEPMLPHVAERPLSLVRCPAGTGERCFFQKHPFAGLNEAVARVSVPGDEAALMVRDLPGLVALVQSGVLEVHPWGARVEDVDRPDRMIFDFDPAPDVPFAAVMAAAREVRERLAARDLRSFVKTTGGKGLHVVVPLAPGPSWAQVKGFADAMAEAMSADEPGGYITSAGKADRAGRIFIDVLRNAREATAVAPFSPRARPGATVSTPLAWDELDGALRPAALTVKTVPARLAALSADPWAGFFDTRQKIPMGTRQES
ncbi:MAG TPA: non-homologous end-joining DNA ligase [Microvirga sp.]|jgi:bifunctional non-homologous end joining protein LigD